ncbi:hypothetical protein FDUTEX481_05513 [Tolypothrix sp. PCC 7601]|nr:hypothetical protein FDUTEX481_05513 [Tolypothrix sp. PCC 7601]
MTLESQLLPCGFRVSGTSRGTHPTHWPLLTPDAINPLLSL